MNGPLISKPYFRMCLMMRDLRIMLQCEAERKLLLASYGNITESSRKAFEELTVYASTPTRDEGWFERELERFKDRSK